MALYFGQANNTMPWGPVTCNGRFRGGSFACRDQRRLQSRLDPRQRDGGSEGAILRGPVGRGSNSKLCPCAPSPMQCEMVALCNFVLVTSLCLAFFWRWYWI